MSELTAQQKYYKQHRDEIIRMNRQYALEHHQEYINYQREYYKKNRLTLLAKRKKIFMTSKVVIKKTTKDVHGQNKPVEEVQVYELSPPEEGTPTVVFFNGDHTVTFD